MADRYWAWSVTLHKKLFDLFVWFFFVQSYPTKFCQKSINRPGLDGACPTQRAVASFESPLVRPSFHCPAVFEACPILQKKERKHAIIIVDFCLWKKKQFSVRCFNIMFPCPAIVIHAFYSLAYIYFVCLSWNKKQQILSKLLTITQQLSDKEHKTHGTYAIERE